MQHEYVMNPAGGAGANTALRDATALAEALAQASTGAPLISEPRQYEADDLTAHGVVAVRESARDGAERSLQNPLPVA
ncbi:FAD-dependent monooxygenase [Streptomyces sp. NPDC051572]|jgi:2-polyprenyl-6-methoxyphenol hydroxylase-like FAD-dependent oxidoreductase|uniref:FAD-dependent monooxygenase n=1 Tax=Streptomyces sp. NPDC051572 TaxID=3155802 RepID=UPI0034509C92